MTTSCNKVGNIDDTLILGKGGMGIKSLYPMNSAASHYYASKHKLAGVEIDVQITKDGELIAFHDEFLDQTTNLSGSVYQYTWDELYNKARYDDIKFKEYKLVSVKEIIEYYDTDIILGLDCKQNNYNRDTAYITKYTNAILEVRKLNPNIIVESEDERFLNIFNELDIDTYIAKNDFLEAFNIAKNNNYTGIVVADYLCNEELMELADEYDIKVELWQSKHSTERNLDLEPHIYQTNDVVRFK